MGGLFCLTVSANLFLLGKIFDMSDTNKKNIYIYISPLPSYFVIAHQKCCHESTELHETHNALQKTGEIVTKTGNGH